MMNTIKLVSLFRCIHVNREAAVRQISEICNLIYANSRLIAETSALLRGL